MRCRVTLAAADGRNLDRAKLPDRCSAGTLAAQWARRLRPGETVTITAYDETEGRTPQPQQQERNATQ